MKYNKFDLGQTVYVISQNGYIQERKIQQINIQWWSDSPLVEYTFTELSKAREKYVFASKEDALKYFIDLNDLQQ